MNDNGQEKNKDILVEVKNARKYFELDQKLSLSKKQFIKAVDDVSFSIAKGETFGLVGESGSGKSTIGKLILKLLPSTGGDIYLSGMNINQHSNKSFRKLRKDYQMVFQDSSYMLDPKMLVEDILAEPLIIHNIVRKDKIYKEVKKLLGLVGLPKNSAKKFPHEFSGGEKQRIGIAKALASRPKFIVCDEPTSALDVSIQSKILNLLMDLQREYELTYLFIAHGLNVVKHVSHRVGVMYLGKLLEIGNVDEIYNNPKHPYTKALISAFPDPSPEANKDRIILKGEIPSQIDRPKGCLFHTRCAYANRKCKQTEPLLSNLSDSRSVACFYPITNKITL